MRQTNTGGRDSVVPGQGDSSHSDLANAVAGAVWLANAAGTGQRAKLAFFYNTDKVDRFSDDSHGVY